MMRGTNWGQAVSFSSRSDTCNLIFQAMTGNSRFSRNYNYDSTFWCSAFFYPLFLYKTKFPEYGCHQLRKMPFPTFIARPWATIGPFIPSWCSTHLPNLLPFIYLFIYLLLLFLIQTHQIQFLYKKFFFIIRSNLLLSN